MSYRGFHRLSWSSFPEREAGRGAQLPAVSPRASGGGNFGADTRKSGSIMYNIELTPETAADRRFWKVPGKEENASFDAGTRHLHSCRKEEEG